MPCSPSTRETAQSDNISPSLLRIRIPSSASTPRVSSVFAGQTTTTTQSSTTTTPSEHGRTPRDLRLRSGSSREKVGQEEEEGKEAKARLGDVGRDGFPPLTATAPEEVNGDGQQNGERPTPTLLTRSSSGSVASATLTTTVAAMNTGTCFPIQSSNSGVTADEVILPTTNTSDATGTLYNPGSTDRHGKSNATEGLKKIMNSTSGRDLVKQATATHHDVERLEKRVSIKETGRANKGKQRQDSFPPRRYYVLTDAGKPVFDSDDRPENHHVDHNHQATTTLMGLVQVIISIFSESGDTIRSIKRGKLKISFLVRPPLYLVCTSDWGEPDFVLKAHLECLHLQLLSIITETQLHKVFQRSSNFDLRRLLQGSESCLYTLLDDLQTNLSLMASALQPLRMSPAVRDAAGQALAPPDKTRDLLYVLLVAAGKVVTLLRPRRHSIHPTDLHLILNLINSSPGLQKATTWLPLCLPKFNANGFVYALVDFPRPDLGIVFVSADKEAYEGLQRWKASVFEKLERDHLFGKIQSAIVQDPYTVSEVGYSGLIHFWYKSRQYVQVTMPAWQCDDSSWTRKRMVTLYQQLYDSIHGRSDHSVPRNQDMISTESETCFGWMTRSFELYVVVEPELSKSAVMGAANAVARWVNKQEARVFLKEAPVF